MSSKQGKKAKEELERRKEAKRQRTLPEVVDGELLKSFEPPPKVQKTENKESKAGTKRTVRSYIPWEEATTKHPYYDKLHYKAVITSDHHIRDADGNLLAVFIKNAVPDKVCSTAKEILSKVPKSSDLRSFTNGGRPPQSGISGYYDYAGTPQIYKCRKTSFTHDHFKDWVKCFPLVEYANEFYKKALPGKWKLQNKAIPDPVRIRKSVFSTMTVNRDFRTAAHTDCGDFDHGFGLITVIDGHYNGVMLGLPEARVCVDLRPGDFLLFDTHCQHANTEVEPIKGNWNRLTCVLYYRFRLGEATCMDLYQDRKKRNDANKKQKIGTVDDSLESVNERNRYNPPKMDVVSMILGWAEARPNMLPIATGLAENSESILSILEFKDYDPKQCDVRDEKEYEEAREYFDIAAIKMKARESGHKYSGGFSLQMIQSLEEEVQKKKDDGLCDLLVLRKVFGEDLIVEWVAVKQNWLDQIDKAWKVTRKTKTRAEARLCWNNSGLLQEAFTNLCDVSAAMFEAKNGVESMSDCPSSDRESWWLGFAVHLIRVCLHELNIPLTYVTLQKLNVKLKDYEFGGTRYSKDYSEEYIKERKARVDKLKALRDKGEGIYGKAKLSTWASNDMFDYQTEDAAVNYKELGLPDPRVVYANFTPATEKRKKSKADLSSVLVWRRGVPAMSNKLSRRLKHQLRPSADIPEIEGVDITVGRPTKSEGEQAYNVICLVDVLSTVKKDEARREIEQAAAMLTANGILIVKECSPTPVDYTRLTSESLKKRKEFVLENCTAVNKAAGYEVTDLCEPKTLIDYAAGCGLTNCCGIYQVLGSCLNEYYVTFSQA